MLVELHKKSSKYKKEEKDDQAIKDHFKIALLSFGYNNAKLLDLLKIRGEQIREGDQEKIIEINERIQKNLVEPEFKE